jgi:hypothetical protein
MSLSTSIIGLLIATGVPLSASAATSIPATEPTFISQGAITLRHNAPAPEICDESDPNQIYYRSPWLNTPCRPCISPDEIITSGYAVSEVQPYCR